LAIFVGVGLAPVWLKAAHYCFGEYDFGIYGQGLARLSWSDPNPWLPGRQIFLFADHFDPVLWLALPAADGFGPRAGGLITETLFVLLSAAPLIWLVRKGNLSRRAASLLSVLLLCNAGTLSALAFPFHPTTWAIFPWMLLIASLRRRSWPVCILALLLLFACKEEFPFVGLVLASLLWMRGDRRWATGVSALSLTWLLAAFVVRPQLLGPTHPYARHLFEGLLDHPGQYLLARIATPHLWQLGLIALPAIPLLVTCIREGRRLVWLPLVLMAPPLAIRFLGDAWRHHYGAVIVAGLVGTLVFWIQDAEIPRWLIAATLALVIVSNVGPIDEARRVLSAREPRWCPGDSARLEALNGSLTIARNLPGALLIEGNLLPALVERSDAFMLFGPSSGATFQSVLVEKPPHGDTWPGKNERLQSLIEQWKRQPGVRILRDDPNVFLAEGLSLPFPSP
jgi:hypothetical protein